MDSRIKNDQQGWGWGSTSDKVAGRGLSKQVTLELRFRDEAGSVLGRGGGIFGKQAEWAQSPRSRNASGELEGQEDALAVEADNGKVDGVVKPDLAGFAITLV